jgi:hypothetical protein
LNIRNTENIIYEFYFVIYTRGPFRLCGTLF